MAYNYQRNKVKFSRDPENILLVASFFYIRVLLCTWSEHPWKNKDQRTGRIARWPRYWGQWLGGKVGHDPKTWANVFAMVVMQSVR